MAYDVKLEERVDEYEFPVYEQDAVTENGLVIPNARAIVRGDTDEVVGLVKSAYKVLTHADALNPILEAFEKTGEKVHKNVSLTQNGARMYANLTFPEHQRSAGGGDNYWPGITVTNSLDGTRKYMTEMEILRLVCTNGMRLPHRIAGFSIGHHKNAEWDDQVHRVLELFEQPEQFEFITAWNQIAGPNKRNEEIVLDEIEKVIESDGCIFPKRYTENVKDYYQNHEDGFTVWNFYSAFNSVVEHDIKREKEKIERARSLDANLFDTFEMLYGN